MQLVDQITADRRLSLSEIVDALCADGLIDRTAAEQVLADRRLQRAELHPLTVLADQKWNSLISPHKLLHINALTEWLAKHVGMDYFHIDPLKINFAAVTDVMSSAYATRFKILPVEVNSREAVIATSEPYVKEWEREMAQILRLRIRRVLASPDDINRFLVEFYSLARSVKRAVKTGDSGGGW